METIKRSELCPGNEFVIKYKSSGMDAAMASYLCADNNDFPIFDSHGHCLTKNHVPSEFKNVRIGKTKIIGFPMKDWFLKPLQGSLAFLSFVFPSKKKREELRNISNFIDRFDSDTSRQVFDKAISYERRSIHAQLMMNMTNSVGGKMNMTIFQQMDEMKLVRDNFPERVLPYVALNPLDPEMPSHFSEAIHDYKFKGIKIYPCEGYLPSHPRLMPIFEFCQSHNIPVIAHCSSAAVRPTRDEGHVIGVVMDKDGNFQNVDYKKTFKGEEWKFFNDPKNWIPVLEAYPNLMLSLGHFGGNEEWDKYLSGKERNWVSDIISMISSRRYANLYADTSYMMYNRTHATALIELLKNNAILRSRVLYGTDYYMIEMEGSYRDMRSWFITSLGDTLMDNVAFVNPMRFHFALEIE